MVLCTETVLSPKLITISARHVNKDQLDPEWALGGTGVTDVNPSSFYHSETLAIFQDRWLALNVSAVREKGKRG